MFRAQQYTAKAAFTDERFKNLALGIAGDDVTMPEAAEIVGSGLGRPLSYLQIPISEIRKNRDDIRGEAHVAQGVGFEATAVGAGL